MSPDFDCPYCGEPIEVCHDDGHGMDEDETHQHTCPHCDKSFVFTTSISVTHSAFKADCLNDGNHKWAPTATFPKRHSRMACQDCTVERQATEAERVQYGFDENTP